MQQTALPSTIARSQMTPVLEVEEIERVFGGRFAVHGVSFALEMGDCLALFGPNGAGKTTLLRLLAGLLAPSGGHCRVNGVSLRHARAMRGQVGLISHASMLNGALSARENVEFTAAER